MHVSVAGIVFLCVCHLCPVPIIFIGSSLHLKNFHMNFLPLVDFRKFPNEIIVITIYIDEELFLQTDDYPDPSFSRPDSDVPSTTACSPPSGLGFLT